MRCKDNVVGEGGFSLDLKDSDRFLWPLLFFLSTTHLSITYSVLR
jgi:hypothetical protein